MLRACVNRRLFFACKSIRYSQNVVDAQKQPILQSDKIDYNTKAFEEYSKTYYPAKNAIANKDYHTALNIYKQKSVWERNEKHSEDIVIELVKAERFKDVEELALTLQESNARINKVQQGYIIHGMARRNLDTARKFFDKLHKQYINTYNTIIRAYVTHNNPENLKLGFDLLRRQYQEYQKTRPQLVERLYFWYAQRGDWSQAAQVVLFGEQNDTAWKEYSKYTVSTPDQYNFRNIVGQFVQDQIPWNQLVQVIQFMMQRSLFQFEKEYIVKKYIEHGQLDTLGEFLSSMEKTFNVCEMLMEEYIKRGDLEQQKELLKKMKEEGIARKATGDPERRPITTEIMKQAEDGFDLFKPVEDEETIVEDVLPQVLPEDLSETSQMEDLKDEELALKLLLAVEIDPTVGSIRGTKAWSKEKLDKAFEMLQQLSETNPQRNWTRKQFNFFVTEAGKVAKKK
jgi:hypothetical protein